MSCRPRSGERGFQRAVNVEQHNVVDGTQVAVSRGVAEGLARRGAKLGRDLGKLNATLQGDGLLSKELCRDTFKHVARIARFDQSNGTQHRGCCLYVVFAPYAVALICDTTLLGKKSRPVLIEYE